MLKLSTDFYLIVIDEKEGKIKSKSVGFASSGCCFLLSCLIDYG